MVFSVGEGEGGQWKKNNPVTMQLLTSWLTFQGTESDIGKW